MSLFKKKTLWDKVSDSLPSSLPGATGQQLVRSGLQAGAGLIVLSVASAVASAARRREQ